MSLSTFPTPGQVSNLCSELYHKSGFLKPFDLADRIVKLDSRDRGTRLLRALFIPPTLPPMSRFSEAEAVGQYRGDLASTKKYLDWLSEIIKKVADHIQGILNKKDESKTSLEADRQELVSFVTNALEKGSYKLEQNFFGAPAIIINRGDDDVITIGLREKQMRIIRYTGFLNGPEARESQELPWSLFAASSGQKIVKILESANLT